MEKSIIKEKIKIEEERISKIDEKIVLNEILIWLLAETKIDINDLDTFSTKMAYLKYLHKDLDEKESSKKVLHV